MSFNTLKGDLTLIGIVMIFICIILVPYKMPAQSALYYASNNNSPVGIPGIKVGNLPTCIYVNQEKNLIYVCNSASDTISVIDGTTNTVINSIFVGENFPDTIALDSWTNRLYVGSDYSKTGVLKEIDTVTNNIIDSIPIENVSISMVSDLSGYLYITTGWSEKIVSVFALLHEVNGKAYNLENNSSKGVREPDKYDLSATAFAKSTSTLFVVKNSNNTVCAFSVNFGSLSPEGTFVIKGENNPRWTQSIAIDPGTNMVYVANPEQDSVSVMSGTSPYGIIKNIAMPSNSQPGAIAINPKTHMIYVASIFSGSVYVINSECIIEHKGCIKGAPALTPVKVSCAEYKHGLCNKSEI
jgi:YVTN family beta-propeller protein